MIKINLLPQSKIKKAEHNEVIAVAQLLFFVLVIVFGINYFILTMKIRNLNNELSLSKVELNKYQALISELNSIEAITQELQSKRDLIKELMNARVLYPMFMEDLLKHLGGGMWLTSLSTQSSEDGTITADFSGTAIDIYTIADLVKTMESSKVIKDPQLGAISQVGDEASPMYNFTMRITYKR